MRKRAGLGIALVAVTVALVPGLARAGAGDDAVIISSRSLRIGPTVADGHAAVPCVGRRAVGGGVGTTATPPNSSLFISGPFGPDRLTGPTRTGNPARYWYAYIHGFSQQRAKIFAICSQTSEATLVASLFQLGPQARAGVPAFCPAGTRVIGGGVGTTAAAPASRLAVSGPLDENTSPATTDTGDVAKSWYAYVINASDAPHDYKVFAICSRESTATLAAVPVSSSGADVVQATAPCPRGSRALSGGVDTTAAIPPGSIDVSGPLDQTGLTRSTTTGDVARSWYARVRNSSAGDRTYKVIAICEPPSRAGAGGSGITRCKGKAATIFATRRTTIGTDGADVIIGRKRRDTILAGAGKDLVCAGRGNDTVKGGAGKDKLFGQGGKDKLFGGAGKDVLKGGPGRDITRGGPGRDVEKP